MEINDMVVLPQSGEELTRGSYGFPVRQVTAVWRDPDTGYRPVTPTEFVVYGLQAWGAWDPDWGWIAPWPAEEQGQGEPRVVRGDKRLTALVHEGGKWIPALPEEYVSGAPIAWGLWTDKGWAPQLEEEKRDE